MLCPKCNAELTSEQKVCVVCGALTPASGYYYSDNKKFRFTKKMRISAYTLGGLFLLCLIYIIFRTIPPNQVAKDWLNAMCNRRLSYCSSMVTDDFRTALSDQFSDLREISDNLSMDSVNSNARVVVGNPEYRETSISEKAIVPAALIDKNGQPVRQMRIELVKEGRRWRINSLN